VAARRNDGRARAAAAPNFRAERHASGRRADAEEPFRALLESAPDAMVIVDQAGTIRLVNAQTEALFGYKRAELLGCPVDMLVPERFRREHPAHRRRYAADLQVRRMGAEFGLSGLRRDGSEFPVEISLSPLQTSDGLLVSAAVRDVSERRAAEERISELALIVESSQDAIFTETLDGTITFWNAAAARMYGYTAAEAVGRHVSMLAPPGHEGEIDALLARIGRGEKIDHYDTLRTTSAGDLLDVDILLNPVRTRSGVIVGACAIVRDIGELRRAEQELTVLYQQQRHIALTLQRSLMGSPPEVPGIQTASRYLPATRGVGGDWFDLVPLGAGRTGVLIGDVMGRGLEAATVMGQLRSAANALARTGMPPQQLLDALDAVVRDLPGQLVTCCYLVINASQGEVTGGSAGHLPVLLARPDATVGQLPIPVSVPLGVGDVPHQETTLPVPHGSTLILYTDGLVETRSSDIGRQIETLEAELRAIFTAAPGLGQAADSILASLLPEPDAPADDVTLLLARTPAAPLASVRITLQAEPEQVATGRRFVRDSLTAWNHEELADTACLLASEILTNAVRHARQPVSLRLHQMPGEIIMEITDDYVQLPRRTSPELDDEFGRGLALVEALSESWGALPTRVGKIVWFTLATGARHPAASLADALAAARTNDAETTGQAGGRWGNRHRTQNELGAAAGIAVRADPGDRRGGHDGGPGVGAGAAAGGGPGRGGRGRRGGVHPGGRPAGADDVRAVPGLRAGGRAGAPHGGDRPRGRVRGHRGRRRRQPGTHAPGARAGRGPRGGRGGPAGAAAAGAGPARPGPAGGAVPVGLVAGAGRR
jgi:PAS domain S-box-containing protein